MTVDLAWVPPYVARDRSGVGYLLDPCDTRLPGLVRQRQERRPGTECDPDAVAADLRALQALFADRHFGIATGLIPTERRDAALTAVLAAAGRVERERPRTWGEAIGDLCDRLRLTLADRHVQIPGAPPSSIRAHKPVLRGDDGPAVEIDTAGDVLTVRVRTLVGGGDRDADLEAWVADADHHFGHRRIVVDLRSNQGGDDGYTLAWMQALMPRL